ncbi:hypothetical protein EYF80_059509 [Liparis tanakae]|uniref:Uncharacterized protein n=1 Tax=Liparis tanakae TaxID=230148 RepID=A0A4Z2ENL4_9TELE|nr:hypothetical protein EYF80_059509 [Liparis tanakae]
MLKGNFPGSGPVGLEVSALGNTEPWMVVETRAETVSRWRSGEAEPTELSEDALESLPLRCGFDPFSGALRGVVVDPVGVPTPFTVTPGDVAFGRGEGGEEEEEESTGVSDFEAPDWTGAGGARHLILLGCD